MAIFEMTFPEIMQIALDRVPNTVDKREGSIIYDAIAPCCYVLWLLHQNLNWAMEMSFPDTAEGEYLESLASERGLYREAATNATILAKITPSDLDIEGTRYSCEMVNFIAVEPYEDEEPGLWTMRCETDGTAGNVAVGERLVPIETVDGLQSAIVWQLLEPAEDEETDDELRARYFESINNAAFGGNISDYILKTTRLPGVGKVRVLPVWNGGGTVKVIFTDSTGGAPSEELVEEVQTALDPEVNQGKGLGIAPIGHVVTVVGASEVTANIEINAEYARGWSFEDARTVITAALQEYIDEVAGEFGQDTTLVVRIFHIMSALDNLECIQDVNSVKINGAQSNLLLLDDQIPVLGTVTEG